MAELADALDLGSSAARRAGSSPVPGTTTRAQFARSPTPMLSRILPSTLLRKRILISCRPDFALARRLPLRPRSLDRAEKQHSRKSSWSQRSIRHRNLGEWHARHVSAPTVDGGNTWIAAQVPAAESLDFRDVEGFSSDLAYLLSAGPGEQSRIYKTTNAGKSWVLQMTNHDPMGFLDCMAFWDLDHGIVVGDPVDGKFVLFLTDDGGTHWVQVPASRIPPAFDGEGAFAASGTSIAVQASGDVWFGTGGKAARVFHSSDRGRTWAVMTRPLSTEPIRQKSFRSCFVNYATELCRRRLPTSQRGRFQPG